MNYKKLAKNKPRFYESPHYFAKSDLYKEIIKNLHFIKGKVLDFGCGSKSYQELFEYSEYIGLEHDNENTRKHTKADFFYDGKTFPFENNEFDSVISTQVLEHVPNPQEILFEMNRVLKKDGYMLISMPFLQEEHESPYDFYRFSPYAVRALFNNAGFEIVEYKKLTCGIKAVISTLNFYQFRMYLDKKSKIAKMMTEASIILFNLLGILLYKLNKNEGCVYVNNFIIAKKSEDF